MVKGIVGFKGYLGNRYIGITAVPSKASSNGNFLGVVDACGRVLNGIEVGSVVCIRVNYGGLVFVWHFLVNIHPMVRCGFSSLCGYI
ncbi:hypothetical protein ES708_18186 [subsurface metagenome]